MKVIIQDIAAREFLAANGQWVADATEAQDFYTLLRAYHFAQANTSIHFRVVLHCPDDDYSASIIEGFGLADEDLGFYVKKANQTPKKNSKPLDIHQRLAMGFDSGRLHLN
jgi:hypothetical protein